MATSETEVKSLKFMFFATQRQNIINSPNVDSSGRKSCENWAVTIKPTVPVE